MANDLGIELPRNLGDILYAFRFRRALPDAIVATEPDDSEWVIETRGRSLYHFLLVPRSRIEPNEHFEAIKIPDSTRRLSESTPKGTSKHCWQSCATTA